MKRNNVQRLMLLYICVLASMTALAAKAPKYIFYFITDGTGVNEVLAAEMYEAEKQGFIGRVPFCMTQFPVVSYATTFSANSGVTDSAASGTALATGHKTQNSTLGLKADKKTPVESVALWAKQAGYCVGIATSVPVNHATPAAFYAHQESRNSYYAIGKELIESPFDFFGGASINDNIDKKNHPGEPDLYVAAEQAGFAVARGAADYDAKAPAAKKMLLVQDNERLNPASGTYSLPYAIDRKDGELSIEEVLRCELDFLQKHDNGKGFFLMNEIGGKVDYACHARDAATAIEEIKAVDRCVAMAMEFYKKHPKETLIVLTSDHETGGMALGRDNIYDLNLKVLANQKVSTDGFTHILRQLRRDTKNQVTWEMARKALEENFGFWGAVAINKDEEKNLYDVWQKSFEGKAEDIKGLYSSNEPLCEAARKIINHKALIAWTTTGHSGGVVPVFAIGPGSELFTAMSDNTDIPVKIAKAMGIKK